MQKNEISSKTQNRNKQLLIKSPQTKPLFNIVFFNIMGISEEKNKNYPDKVDNRKIMTWKERCWQNQRKLLKFTLVYAVFHTYPSCPLTSAKSINTARLTLQGISIFLFITEMRSGSGQCVHRASFQSIHLVIHVEEAREPVPHNTGPLPLTERFNGIKTLHWWTADL